MGPKTKQLVKIIEELISLLNKYEVENWSQWMQQSLNRIKNSDFSGVTHLLAAYGGMGSFNDLVFTLRIPQQPKGTQLPQDNEMLNKLSSEAYKLATEIKKEVEASSHSHK